MIKPQRFKAILTKKEKISSKVYEVTFTLTEPPEIEFRCGHTIMIYIEPGVNRSMSIASSPHNPKEISMCWDVSPMGKGCQRLLARNIGDPVEFMGPLGIFLYDEQDVRKSIFVATGTGIAPFHAALDTFLSSGHMKNASLYWGLRHEEDIFWKDKLDRWSTDHTEFTYNIVLSQPSDSWTGKKGHVQDYLFAEEQQLKDSTIYLCGSGKMIEQVVEKLISLEVPHNQIKRELFFG